MSPARLLRLVGQNLRRNKKNFIFSSFGILVGISTFMFFMGLGEGIRTVVMDKVFVYNQLEIIPKSYEVGAFKTDGGLFGGSRLTDASVEEIRGVPGVRGVYPKMKLTFPARAWGGQELMGRNFYTELIADGIPDAVVKDEITGPAAFRDWDAAPIGCVANDGCPDGQTCGGGVCHKTTCKPPATDNRGNITGDDPCPGKSYCGQDTRTCEMPIPVLANPRLLEIYNGSIHTAMKGTDGALSKMPRLSPAALVGLQFYATLGKSYLGSSGAGEPITRRFELVGFSDKAIGIGVTLPIGYVQRFNARFRGKDGDGDYHSLLVETDNNEAVVGVANYATERMNLDLDDKYENAQKAGLIITIITAIFTLISVVIIGIAAVNIMHTFLMVIVERGKEIGLMRALGATKGDISAIILLEAAAIGFVGGAVGSAVGVGMAMLSDVAFDRFVADFPFKPDTLFAWEPWFFAVAVGGAILFCLLGAFVPALRAANLDPAAALTGR